MNKLMRISMVMIALLGSLFSVTQVHAYYGNFGAYVAEQYKEKLRIEAIKADQALWEFEYKPKIVMLHGDITTPIVVGNQYLASHPVHGELLVDSQDKEAVSAIMTPIAVSEMEAGTFNDFRPTLYITIPGQKEGEIFGSGSGGPYPWQNEFQKQLFREYAVRSEQYVHMAVDWQSIRTNRKQIEVLGKQVRNFLNSKIDEWDVVIVGHSRGAILGDGLIKEIKSAKVNRVYSYYLDPTANKPAGDIYPNKKTNFNSAVSHDAYMYYDGSGFIDGDFEPLSGSLAVSDKQISGYNNIRLYGVGHMSMLDEFVISDPFLSRADRTPFAQDFGMLFVMDNVFTNKTQMVGGYRQDGEDGLIAVTVKVREFDVYADLDIMSGNLVGDLTISLGSVSITHHIEVGSDGLVLQAGTIVATAQAIINEDQIYLSNSTFITDTYAGLSEDGVKAGVKVLKLLKTDISVDEDNIRLEIKIFGKDGKISVDTEDAVLGLLTKGSWPVLKESFNQFESALSSINNRVKKWFGW